MSNSAKSIFYFGIYLSLLGVTLVFAPNFLLQLFGFESTTEVWIRVVGILAMVIGFLDITSGINDSVHFFKMSCFVRLFVFLSFIVLVASDLAKPMLILFGTIDLFGTLWTYLALKKEKKW